MISARPHQIDAVEQLRQGFAAGALRQILVMPTGSGKTITAAMIVLLAKEKGKIVLFIVDRIALAVQAADVMRECGLITSIMRGEDTRIEQDHDVIVASIQTLDRRRVPAADLIIIDEAHIMHKAHAKLLDRWDAVPCIGLTATPYAKGMGKHFSRVISPTSIGELTDLGLLVPIIAYGPAQFDVSGVKTQAGDYAVGELSRAVNSVQIHADVTETWAKLGEGRQTLAFGVDIAHSKALAAAFVDAGVKAEHLDGYDDVELRADVIGRFKDGETTILCSVACLSVGFDAPAASCLILARPTKSLILHLQQIGRGLRPFEGKENCLIIDHAGNLERHGFPADVEVGELDDGTKTWGTAGSSDDPLPKLCGSCSYLKPPRVHECPKCGFAPQKKSDVEATSEQLVAIRQMTRDDRNLYRQFLGIAQQRGKSRGWAYHLFVGKTGSKPLASWRDDYGIEPGRDARRYAKSRLIAYAKARKGEQA